MKKKAEGGAMKGEGAKREEGRRWERRRRNKSFKAVYDVSE